MEDFYFELLFILGKPVVKVYFLALLILIAVKFFYSTKKDYAFYCIGKKGHYNPSDDNNSYKDFNLSIVSFFILIFVLLINVLNVSYIYSIISDDPSDIIGLIIFGGLWAFSLFCICVKCLDVRYVFVGRKKILDGSNSTNKLNECISRVEEVDRKISPYDCNPPKTIRLSNEDVVNYLYDNVTECFPNESNSSSNSISLFDKMRYILRVFNKYNIDYLKGYSYYSCLVSDAPTKESEIVFSHLSKNERDSKRSLFSSLDEDDEDDNTLFFHQIFVGEYNEEYVKNQISQIIDKLEDCYIVKGFRHQLINETNVKSSENDLLILTKKGIYTIEIKSIKRDCINISSSGNIDVRFNKSPISQALSHKLYLIDLINKKTNNKFKKNNSLVTSALYFPNVDEINNFYPEILAFSDPVLLINHILSKEEIITDEEFEEIKAIIDSNKLDPIKYEYTIKSTNCFKTFALIRELREDIRFIDKYNYSKYILDQYSSSIKDKLFKSIIRGVSLFLCISIFL